MFSEIVLNDCTCIDDAVPETQNELMNSTAWKHNPIRRFRISIFGIVSSSTVFTKQKTEICRAYCELYEYLIEIDLVY